LKKTLLSLATAAHFTTDAMVQSAVASAQPMIGAALCWQSRRFFTPDEDRQIKNWVVEHGTEDWNELATTMPLRTPRTIRQRWVHYLAPAERKDPWTLEEDRMLLNKRRDHGPRWVKISQFLPGRTCCDVKNRWDLLRKLFETQQLQPYTTPFAVAGQSSTVAEMQLTSDVASVRHSRWHFTVDEDRQIINWVARRGTAHWNELAQTMPLRNWRAISERWHHHLSPKVSKCPWTLEEDQTLIDKTKELGPSCWAKISRCLSGRTPPQVRNRWKIISLRSARKNLTESSAKDPLAVEYGASTAEVQFPEEQSLQNFSFDEFFSEFYQDMEWIL
jgi:hypothetical protein